MTWFWKLKVPEQLVQIDIDSGQIGVNYPVKVGIVADATEALSALLKKLAPQKSSWSEIWERARNCKHATFFVLAHCLASAKQQAGNMFGAGALFMASDKNIVAEPGGMLSAAAG